MGSTLDTCQPWYVGIRYNGCLDAKAGMDLMALLPRSRLVTCPIFWWTTGDTIARNGRLHISLRTRVDIIVTGMWVREEIACAESEKVSCVRPRRTKW